MVLMGKKALIIFLFLLAAATVYAGPLPLPPAGQMYHGVYPGGAYQEQDVITTAELTSYQTSVGKKAVWVYFSDDWFRGRGFPNETAGWIRDNGSIPFIRLMLRSSDQMNTLEATFTLDRIASGEFDADLRAWFQSAREFKTPLLVEYGTEVNGQWFSWNGVWNGGTAGVDKFKNAYRHIIQLARDQQADNLTWVFHVNYNDDPATGWNRFENYYPGDEWIDWLGVSVYGEQTPDGLLNFSFRTLMDRVYARLAKLSPGKPVAVLEFGVTSLNTLVNQANWADDALKDLTRPRWPRVVGFAWWNEAWHNYDEPAYDTDMRVEDNPALAKVFRKRIAENGKVLDKFPLPQN